MLRLRQLILEFVRSDGLLSPEALLTFVRVFTEAKRHVLAQRGAGHSRGCGGPNGRVILIIVGGLITL